MALEATTQALQSIDNYIEPGVYYTDPISHYTGPIELDCDYYTDSITGHLYTVVYNNDLTDHYTEPVIDNDNFTVHYVEPVNHYTGKCKVPQGQGHGH